MRLGAVVAAAVAVEADAGVVQTSRGGAAADKKRPLCAAVLANSKSVRLSPRCGSIGGVAEEISPRSFL